MLQSHSASSSDVRTVYMCACTKQGATRRRRVNEALSWWEQLPERVRHEGRSLRASSTPVAGEMKDAAKRPSPASLLNIGSPTRRAMSDRVGCPAAQCRLRC